MLVFFVLFAFYLFYLSSIIRITLNWSAHELRASAKLQLQLCRIHRGQSQKKKNLLYTCDSVVILHMSCVHHCVSWGDGLSTKCAWLQFCRRYHLWLYFVSFVYIGIDFLWITFHFFIVNDECDRTRSTKAVHCAFHPYLIDFHLTTVICGDLIICLVVNKVVCTVDGYQWKRELWSEVYIICASSFCVNSTKITYSLPNHWK